MHKDVSARVKKAAAEAGIRPGQMKDALVVMGLLLYYHTQEGTDIKPIAVDKVLAGALERAQHDIVAHEKEGLSVWPLSSEEDAWILARQIERETGSE